MNDTVTREKVLADLRAERTRWEALLAEVGAERLTEPGVAGDWSVKDVLGHVTAYLRPWGARLRAASTSVPPTMRDLYDTDSLPEGAGAWTVDEQNAAIRAQYAPLPPAVVLAKWREASDLLEAGVAALTDDDLSAPGRFPWTDGRPLAEAMAGDAVRHPQEHAADVRAWLDRSPA